MTTEQKEHPHAWVLRAIADGEPMGNFETLRKGQGKYHPCDELLFGSYIAWPEHWEIRRKQKMRKIGDKTFPEPLSVKPNRGDTYFVVIPHDSRVGEFGWNNLSCETSWFHLGFCHSTGEAAAQHLAAIMAVAYGEPA